MKKLLKSSDEERMALLYLGHAAMQSKHARCLVHRCGAVLVRVNVLCKNWYERIIGVGVNEPPYEGWITECVKDKLPANFKSDKHCCVHAEQNAIINALSHKGYSLSGSTMYFVRTNYDTFEIIPCGKPFCTVCSKLMLAVGIKEMVLQHDDGIYVYDAEEYNKLSFEYKGDD